jgi:hypothetical protein
MSQAMVELLRGVYGERAAEDLGRFFLEFLRRWDKYRIEADQFVELGDDAVLVGGRQYGSGTSSEAVTDAPLFIVWSFRGKEVVSMHCSLDRGRYECALTRKLFVLASAGEDQAFLELLAPRVSHGGEASNGARRNQSGAPAISSSTGWGFLLRMLTPLCSEEPSWQRLRWFVAKSVAILARN